jgi:uncharacterized repeat protein (TIGR04138 family)
MQEVSFEEAIGLIQLKDSRYKREAYLLVREALDHTQESMRRASRGHVSGQELLAGIREYALTRYGPMAMMLLEEWGVHSCEDFGEIVFNMVENGGSPTFTLEDIRDLRAFTARLQEQSDPVSKFLWGGLSEASRQAVLRGADSQDFQEALVKELNQIIQARPIFQKQRFAGVRLSDQTRSLIGHELAGTQLAAFNRLLLEDAFPTELARSRGLLAKTETDSRADFKNGYDFYEAFRKPFLPPSRQVKREPGPADSSRS